MSLTRLQMETKVRLRLGDKSTRRDGSSVTTPRFPAADIQTAVNDAIRERQADIIAQDPTWYLSVKDLIGQTDSIAADTASTTLPVVANEQYALPDNFLQHVRLARRDLPNLPTVTLVPYQDQDQLLYGFTGLFSGFYSAHPENTAPSGETVSVITHNAGGTQTNRLRVKPAPASTSYLYREFFHRKPTEPSADGHVLDIPSNWVTVIALDGAILLASTANLETLPMLRTERDQALAKAMENPSGRNAGRRVVGDARL